MCPKKVAGRLKGLKDSTKVKGNKGFEFPQARPRGALRFRRSLMTSYSNIRNAMKIKCTGHLIDKRIFTGRRNGL